MFTHFNMTNNIVGTYCGVVYLTCFLESFERNNVENSLNTGRSTQPRVSGIARQFNGLN